MMAGDAQLGSALRSMREARGISLKTAASALGTERHATISEIESGRRAASFAEIVRLSGIYGVTVPDVLAATAGDDVALEVGVSLARADGTLTESDRVALARMERAARDYAALKAVLES